MCDDICICMYYECIDVCMYVLMYGWMYVMLMCMYYECVDVCICVLMYVCADVCMCVLLV